SGGTWTTPVNVAGNTREVAADGQGDLTAVWSYVPGECRDAVFARRRPAGGKWLPPQVIADLGSSCEQNVGEPMLAVDAAGDAVVAWRRLGPAADFIEVITNPAGGIWSVPQALS